MKSIEFGGKSDKESSGEEAHNKTLEMLLLEKNKGLQTENTHLKVTNADLAGRSRFIYWGQGHDFT